jgi:hypothetical protein
MLWRGRLRRALQRRLCRLLPLPLPGKGSPGGSVMVPVAELQVLSYKYLPVLVTRALLRKVPTQRNPSPQF